MKLKKINPILIGLFQAVLVFVYVTLISQFVTSISDVGGPADNELVIGMFMLLLLVFSAGITGILVFGYFAYLLIDKEVKRALTVIGFTFLFLFYELMFESFWSFY